MKKRAFLLPLAVSLAGLIAGGAEASVPDVTAPISSSVIEGSVTAGVPAPAPLVLQRANGATKFAAHGSHSSHASHASHASHSSHYSSRR